MGFFAGTKWLLNPAGAPDAWWHFFLCGVIGVVTSIVFVYITQYYTEYRYRPVKSIADGLGHRPGDEHHLGLRGRHGVHRDAGLRDRRGDHRFLPAGRHRAAWSTPVCSAPPSRPWACSAPRPTSSRWTRSARSPTTPAASSRCRSSPRRSASSTDRLDAVGNTTKALTKGYAIGSAALAAFLLFSAYLDEVADARQRRSPRWTSRKPEVFVGGAARRHARLLVLVARDPRGHQGGGERHQEVRRQFAADPGILKGTSKPDYGRCVDIVTLGALKEMVAPGLLAVGMPIGVGLVFKLFHVGAEAVARPS